MFKTVREFPAKVLIWWLGTSFTVKADEISTSSTNFWASVAAAFGLFSVNEWGVICGIILGIASFILSWVFKVKNHNLLRDKVEQDIIKEMNQ
ncbi:HP1 family phage holin [Shewanella frigidimarina]|jgi:hypothetical protein|uniref:HP1 family phage holin n=1 Tax=Shewanella frigidimarina TaxID=56812 RepID=UPI003D79E7AA